MVWLTRIDDYYYYSVLLTRCILQLCYQMTSRHIASTIMPAAGTRVELAPSQYSSLCSTALSAPLLLTVLQPFPVLCVASLYPAAPFTPYLPGLHPCLAAAGAGEMPNTAVVELSVGSLQMCILWQLQVLRRCHCGLAPCKPSHVLWPSSMLQRGFTSAA
jgi:hypothetical protein